MLNTFNLKSFFKFLSRNKAYTCINVIGFSVSLMFVLFIAVYTWQELTTDQFQKNKEQIYVLTNERVMGTAPAVGSWLKDRYPEIEEICRVIPFDLISVSYNENAFSAEIYGVEDTFFELFSFPLKEGIGSEVLKDRHSAVVSESFARKTFGSEDPIGKTLKISDSTQVVVTGIMQDIKGSLFKPADFLIRIERISEFNNSLAINSETNAGQCITFMQTKPGSDFKSREADILQFFNENFWLYSRGFASEVHLYPMQEVYFCSFQYGSMNHGDKKFIYILMTVGLLILIFAIFNYINLTVAQAGLRAKEMATRRLLGSSRAGIFWRMMFESVLLTLISLGIALLLVFAFRNKADYLLQTVLQLDMLFSAIAIVLISLLIFGIGMISGFLPSLLISASRPIEIVRGTFVRQTKMVFSKCFIIFQHCITIALIAVALTMFLQMNHLIHAPLGYNTNNIISFENGLSTSQAEALRDKLLQSPFVQAVGFTNGTPFSGTNNWSTQYEGVNLSFQQMKMDSVAFRILGLKLVQDNRLASDKSAYYLTEKALRDMNLSNDAAVFHIEEDVYPIAGILQDFQLRNINLENSPVMFRFVTDDKRANCWDILVETNGEAKACFQAVSHIYKELTQKEFEGEFLEQQIQQSFDQQIRLTQIVVIFAGIAILISLLGLLAMATYFIQQRTKEVAVRKVFGSNNREILIKLISTFLLYVVVAFVIATPISWYFAREWLMEYSYRIFLNPLIFLVSGFFCLLISFCTVFLQSWKVANSNPVKGLKSV